MRTIATTIVAASRIRREDGVATDRSSSLLDAPPRRRILSHVDRFESMLDYLLGFVELLARESTSRNPRARDPGRPRGAKNHQYWRPCRTEPVPFPHVSIMAGPTGLEPATSGVTGRRSNQLNYDPAAGTAHDIGIQSPVNLLQRFFGTLIGLLPSNSNLPPYPMSLFMKLRKASRIAPMALWLAGSPPVPAPAPASPTADAADYTVTFDGQRFQQPEPVKHPLGDWRKSAPDVEARSLARFP